jgi:hypothetical protein
MRTTITQVVAALVFALSLGVADAPLKVTVVADPSSGRSVHYALRKLKEALHGAGCTVITAANPEDVIGGELVLAGTSRANGPAARALREANSVLPSSAEGLTVRRLTVHGRSAIVFCGADDHGLMYALLDAAERVGWTSNPASPFAAVREITEEPNVRDRAIGTYVMNRAYWESRAFDERYWIRYFDLLASNRFNRFHIVFGYENGGFLAPAYPYFFDTPGYSGVHMVGVTPDQQKKNLAALNRIIELGHDRGIAVSLGIWDHIYRGGVQSGKADWLEEYKDKPIPASVEGVTAENLSAYTLASLKELLVKVPAIDGLQFRVHEESGLKKEEIVDFWRQVFRHMMEHKPGMLLELRGKGTPDSVIAAACDLGVNLRMETKYWMEQMGLPYHPTHINLRDQKNRRHGYADFLRYPQRYQMLWRLWNGGTNRILLWADPEYVRRFSESTKLYDSPNWEIQEPLATKMEAQHPDKPPFQLMPEKYRYYEYEFERYWHFYQVWGRIGYNPQTSAEVWQHDFKRKFGAAGPFIESGLHRASQVLPMIVAAVYPYRLFPTTVGWAERQALGTTLAQYAANEGSDLEQFENFQDAAKRIVAGGATSKRSPSVTSRWFDESADAILDAVAKAEKNIGSRKSQEFESTIIDLKILAQLARFHARRTIAAVHYNIFTLTQRPEELIAATKDEKSAVTAWRELVEAAGDHYAFDLMMGARVNNLCGHWRDELAALEKDLQELEVQCVSAGKGTGKPAEFEPGRNEDRIPPTIEHERIISAKPGQPLTVRAKVSDISSVRSVTLRYRHVTQFEDYETVEMKPEGNTGIYSATVPGSAISSDWNFMYFIEAIDSVGNGINLPDLAREQPYVMVKTHAQ